MSALVESDGVVEEPFCAWCGRARADADHTTCDRRLATVDPPRHCPVCARRMIVQVDDEAFDLGPGSTITIPPGARHTFTVLSPTIKFLAMSLTGAMGRFHADLNATVPHDRPIEKVAQQVQRVLGRHDVTVVGLDAADPETVS